MSRILVDQVRSNSASGDAITLDSNGKCAINATTINSLTFPTSDGSADQMLKTNGSGALAFATVSSTGKILQTVSTVSTTYYNTTSETFQDTNLSLSITTGSASSKIFVVAYPLVGARGTNGQNAYMQCQLLRDTTHLRYQFSGGWMGNLSSINNWQHYETVSMPYIDTGVSTSTTYAYKIKYRIYTQTIQAQINPHTESGNGGSYIVAMEIAT